MDGKACDNRVAIHASSVQSELADPWSPKIMLPTSKHDNVFGDDKTGEWNDVDVQDGAGR